MKTTKFMLLSIALGLFSLLIQGCYTQLATSEDEGESSYSTRYDEPRADEPDSTYDDSYSYRYPPYRSWIGFDYYYPSWRLGWMYDPWYYDYYYDPWFYPYRWYYRGYYGYYYSPYYGYWNPYYYYGGYPIVVYSDGRVSRTRESGYRRTGAGRTGAYDRGQKDAKGHSTITIPSGSRSAGSRDAGYGGPAPSSRKAEVEAGRGATRGSSDNGRRGQGSSVDRSGSTGRSSAPAVRSAPSSGGSSRSGSNSGGSRSSGGSRGRHDLRSMPRESYRVEPVPVPEYTPSWRSSAPARSSSPSYEAPRYESRSHQPTYNAPSYSSPPTPSSGSGGGGAAGASSSSGGSRSSGASRSGGN